VIEVAEGYPPHLADKTPMAAMMAIARNPPPTLAAASPSWSKTFRNFVAKLLNKRPEHRPDIDKVLDHPFLAKVDACAAVGEMLDILRDLYPTRESDREPIWSPERNPHPLVDQPPADTRTLTPTPRSKPIVYADVENLSALAEVDDTVILAVLQHRFENDNVFTNVGNILVSCNPFKQVGGLLPGSELKYFDPQV
jgi:serine/threonine protein kinase